MESQENDGMREQTANHSNQASGIGEASLANELSGINNEITETARILNLHFSEASGAHMIHYLSRTSISRRLPIMEL